MCFIEIFKKLMGRNGIESKYYQQDECLESAESRKYIWFGDYWKIAV